MLSWRAQAVGITDAVGIYLTLKGVVMMVKPESRKNEFSS